MRTHPMYVCDRCGWGVYHPLSYCVKCPGKMQKRQVPHADYPTTTVEDNRKNLLEQGVVYEGEEYDKNGRQAVESRLGRTCERAIERLEQLKTAILTKNLEDVRRNAASLQVWTLDIEAIRKLLEGLK